MPKLKLLVACHVPVLSGGFLRFERFGRTVAPWGHELSFLVLGDQPEGLKRTGFGHRVLTIEAARLEQWDAVMIPGAGFPDTTIEQFAELQENQFGVRIQHVLNDQSKREGVLAVNRSFLPHVVIFNNRQWPIESLRELSGNQFHVLPGAVDLNIFLPKAAHKNEMAKAWAVGGQDRKNPLPLIQALEYLPPDVCLYLFGSDQETLRVQYAKYVSSGRLVFLGPLNETELASFYHQLDCVVSTEKNAGWSNLSAEALASGVPLICTRAGTNEFSLDNETCILLDHPEPKIIAEAIIKLRGDNKLCQRLAKNGRMAISKFGWDEYSSHLLKLCGHDGADHYFRDPKQNLFGKWPT